MTLRATLGEGFHDERQHVWACTIDHGAVEQLTSGDYDDLAAIWSPDGRTIAFASNRIPDADRHPYRSDIWLVASNGCKPRRLDTPVSSKANLSWSPDGMQIAYTGAEIGDEPILLTTGLDLLAHLKQLLKVRHW